DTIKHPRTLPRSRCIRTNPAKMASATSRAVGFWRASLQNERSPPRLRTSVPSTRADKPMSFARFGPTTPKQLGAVTVHRVMVTSIQTRIDLRGYFPDASVDPTEARNSQHLYRPGLFGQAGQHDLATVTGRERPGRNGRLFQARRETALV